MVLVTHWLEISYIKVQSKILEDSLITGCCYMVRMYEAIMIGLMSGTITFLTLLALERLPIDDPCGSFAGDTVILEYFNIKE